MDIFLLCPQTAWFIHSVPFEHHCPDTPWRHLFKPKPLRPLFPADAWDSSPPASGRAGSRRIVGHGGVSVCLYSRASPAALLRVACRGSKSEILAKSSRCKLWVPAVYDGWTVRQRSAVQTQERLVGMGCQLAVRVPIHGAVNPQLSETWASEMSLEYDFPAQK